MSSNVPHQPVNSFRVTLTLSSKASRLDSVLIEALRNQNEILELKNISRSQFKQLFKEKKIRIKGQNALPSSSVPPGTTYVDVLGYSKKV